jgi:hypothetical protein
MANVTPEKEDIFVVIQSLEVDEARLTGQKEHLTILLNQLETKAKEEFKKRKRKVARLKSEVLDLQEKCSKFACWINGDSTLECSQATLSEDMEAAPTEDKGVDVKEPCEPKTLSAILESVETAPTEDKGVDVNEPDWVKEARALLQDRKTAPTEDKKVMPPKVCKAKRNWLFGSSDKKKHAKRQT